MTAAPLHRLSLVARPASRLVSESGALPDVQGQRGPDQTVDELLASHADAVYRFALRLTREPHAAQDLTQETLLRGWKSRSSLRDAAAARVWLLRIAANLHRDAWRSRQPIEPLIGEPIDREPTVAGRHDQRECVAQVLAALDDLPPRQRQAMHLITIEQLTHQQAAEVLGVSVESLKANLSLARRRMREHLKDLYEELRGTRTK